MAEGKHYPSMNGKRVFKHAVTKMPAAIMEGMVTNNLTLGDIDMIIPHQANLRINQTPRRLPRAIVASKSSPLAPPAAGLAIAHHRSPRAAVGDACGSRTTSNCSVARGECRPGVTAGSPAATARISAVGPRQDLEYGADRNTTRTSLVFRSMTLHES